MLDMLGSGHRLFDKALACAMSYRASAFLCILFILYSGLPAD
jgi:hypothetical protein